jgi:hypothetical protein
MLIHYSGLASTGSLLFYEIYKDPFLTLSNDTMLTTSSLSSQSSQSSQSTSSTSSTPSTPSTTPLLVLLKVREQTPLSIITKP